MNKFAAGSSVSLTVSLKNEAGVSYGATNIAYTAVNEIGATKASGSQSVDGSLASVAITLDAASNAIADDAEGGFRRVTFTLTTNDGTVRSEQSYLLIAAVRLDPPYNSFQSFEEAMIESLSMPTLTWDAFDETTKTTALLEAYRRITRLGFRFRDPNDFSRFESVSGIVEDGWVIAPPTWAVLDQEDWDDLPDAFKKALRRAQIVEANEMLTGNPVSDRRRDGLLSETVGESSMMFRSGRPIDMGLFTGTLNELRGYLDFRVTTTRS